MGAVNIVTKNRPLPASPAGKEQLAIRAEGGSFGYFSAEASISKLSTLNTTLSTCFTRSDGYSRAKSGALNADYSGFKAFYQGHYSFPSGKTGKGLYWHAGVSTKGFGSNTFYSAKYDEQYERTTKVFAALQGDVEAGAFHFHPSLYWNRSHDRFELIRGDESKVPFNHHRTDVFGLNLNSWFDWTLGRTAFGAEFRNEDIESGNLGEPLNSPHGNYQFGLNRTNLSFHLEHNILLSRFTLSAGFIAIKNTWSEMPFTLYPGVDASYRIGDNWKVYASYNESLRMPSFTELYYSVGGHKADKHLSPEELRAIEGGVKYLTPRLTARLSIFHHHQRNTIDWVLDMRDPEAVWQSVNLTRINTLGVETDINCQFSILNFQLAYCYLHQQKDDLPNLQSRYSLEYLRHKLTASLQLPLTKQLGLTLKYRFQDRMGNYTDTEGQQQSYHPYSVVDARLAWTADHYALYMEVNNLLGKRYVDYGNVRQPGAWLIAGVKYNLSL